MNETIETKLKPERNRLVNAPIAWLIGGVALAGAGCGVFNYYDTQWTRDCGAEMTEPQSSHIIRTPAGDKVIAWYDADQFSLGANTYDAASIPDAERLDGVDLVLTPTIDPQTGQIEAVDISCQAIE